MYRCTGWPRRQPTRWRITTSTSTTAPGTGATTNQPGTPKSRGRAALPAGRTGPAPATAAVSLPRVDIGDSNVNTAVTGSGRPLSGGFEANSLSKSLLVMSPVFKVSSDPVISVELPIQRGCELERTRARNGSMRATGSVGFGFPLSADQQLATSLTVCLRVTESGGDRVASRATRASRRRPCQLLNFTNGAGLVHAELDRHGCRRPGQQCYRRTGGAGHGGLLGSGLLHGVNR